MAFDCFPAVGDAVAEDEVVCEIETDKVGSSCVSANFFYGLSFVSLMKETGLSLLFKDHL